MYHNWIDLSEVIAMSYNTRGFGLLFLLWSLTSFTNRDQLNIRWGQDMDIYIHICIKLYYVSITWANVNPDLCRLIASLSHKGLMCSAYITDISKTLFTAFCPGYVNKKTLNTPRKVHQSVIAVFQIHLHTKLVTIWRIQQKYIRMSSNLRLYLPGTLGLAWDLLLASVQQILPSSL